MRRRRQESRSILWGAWHAAAWGSFTRQLPAWDRVDPHFQAKPAMTVKQMENMVGLLAAAFGGKLERPPAAAGAAEEAPRG